MRVTLNDILQIDLFKNSKVLAGSKGLYNIVNRVSVFDCPIEVERDNSIFKNGDFFITNFFFLKDDLDEILYTIDFLKSSGCSGLGVTTEYINHIPSYIIEYSNKLDFPIISIDYNIPYTDVIFTISNIILEDKKNSLLEVQLYDLISSKDNIQSQSIINSLNPHFSDYLTCIYCYSDSFNIKINPDVVKMLIKSKNNLCVPYKNGLLLFISYSSTDYSDLDSSISYYINILKDSIPNCILGISSNFIDIINIKESISQAILSYSCSTIENNNTIKYDNLGILSFLINFKNTPEMKKIYDKTIVPIIEYDNNHNKDLLNTLITFVEFQGDYKQTSAKLFQHENTIRYRLVKIKSLLNLEGSNIEFFERVSIGIKLHKIYGNQ